MYELEKFVGRISAALKGLMSAEEGTSRRGARRNRRTRKSAPPWRKVDNLVDTEAHRRLMSRVSELTRAPTYDLGRYRFRPWNVALHAAIWIPRREAWHFDSAGDSLSAPLCNARIFSEHVCRTSHSRNGSPPPPPPPLSLSDWTSETTERRNALFFDTVGQCCVQRNIKLLKKKIDE